MLSNKILKKYNKRKALVYLYYRGALRETDAILTIVPSRIYHGSFLLIACNNVLEKFPIENKYGYKYSYSLGHIDNSYDFDRISKRFNVKLVTNTRYNTSKNILHIANGD